MADIESNVKVNIDTSDALAQLKLLQQQISAFQQAMRKAGADNAAAARAMQQNLVNSINATGKFQANIQTIQTSAERFTTALEKNKLTMGEYFRYAGGASKTFGKLFKQEFDTINQVARERVKDLQTQYIKLGRDANGAMKAISVRPLALDMDNLGTKTQIAAQRQALFNQLMKQGSTQLLNFGKNTQWAGRQLMVGFTVPLTMMGTAAAKAYMEIEKASVSFKRVYGDMNTTTDETNKMVAAVQKLAGEFTKYGVAVADTMDMAAKAAAMGKTGADLIQQITQANKLAVLGNVQQNQALDTTISLTNAFGTSADQLAGKIDFLNAVENQTVTSIEDLTVAIPKAAPVVKQLGGNVEDLTFFLTAMKEGGINASEGANALKSGLASMINPTKKASDFLAGFGINVKAIVDKDKGNVKQTVVDMAKAFDKLDPLNRARAIEMMFGKFQFSRISTLFQNVIKEGSQAQTVAGLAKSTAEELAVLSEREMKKISDSPMYKFQKSIQDIQAKLAPVGEAFLKAVTPIIDFVGKILDGFNNLSDGTKSFVTILVTAVAGIGPALLMGFGLIANGVANLMKMFTNLKSFMNKKTNPSDVLGEQTQYMNSEQLKAAAIASSLDQAHAKLRQTFTSETSAVNELTTAYRNAIQAQQQFSGVPNVPVGNPNAVPPKKYANGVSYVPGPKGAGDIIPALLSPGEAVIPAKHAQKYAPVIAGMVAGNLPGFESGTTGAGMRQSIYGPLTQKQTEGLARTGMQLKDISDEVMSGPYANVPPTDYGTQISPTTGHSFPAFEVGGIYQKPDGTKVFVKPQIDLTSALAEVRGTEIARSAHGLIAPQQKIAVMMDPTDPEHKRRFIVLESALDPRIADIPNTFTKDQYFTQLVASLLRGDKDLGIGNLGGNVLADVGTAGVFGRASGKRALGSAINSMEEQAIINLLGVKGGAKRFFAEATSEMVSKMTPAEYDAAMKAEIQKVIPKLDATIAGFGNLSPEEKLAYQAMQERLRAGLGVDWGKYQVMHSAVPPKKFALGGIVPGYNEGEEKVSGWAKPQLTHIESAWVKDNLYRILTTNKIPKIQKALIETGLNQLSPTVQQMLEAEILGSLVSDSSGTMNQFLRTGQKGLTQADFLSNWNANPNQLLSTVAHGGTAINDPALISAARAINSEIGNAVKPDTDGMIHDAQVSAATQMVLSKYANNSDAYGKIAKALIGQSEVLGEIRLRPDKNAKFDGAANLAEYVTQQFATGKLAFGAGSEGEGITQTVFLGDGVTPWQILPAGNKNGIGLFRIGGLDTKGRRALFAKYGSAQGIMDAFRSGKERFTGSFQNTTLRGSQGYSTKKQANIAEVIRHANQIALGSIPDGAVSDPTALAALLPGPGQKFKMFANGTPNVGATGKPKASIFDIDDTLLNLSDFMVGHKAANEKLPKDQRKDWYKEVAKNPQPIPAGVAALKAAQARGNKIILMTARPESYDPHTRETLAKLGIDMNGIKIIARKDKDYRKPHQMKYEITKAYQKWYDIEEFYDDMDETRGAISLLGIPTHNPLKLAGGVFSVPGPKGAGDVVPAMLSPGEAVIPADKAAKNRGLISNMISGNLPGFRNGTIGVGIQGFSEGGIAGYEQGGFIPEKYNEGHPLPVSIVEDKTVGGTPLSELVPQQLNAASDQIDGVQDQKLTNKEMRELIKKQKEQAKKDEAEAKRFKDNEARVNAGYDQMSKEEKAKFDAKLEKKNNSKGLFTDNKTTGAVSKALYGLTTVAGLASTMPGQIGQAAQAAMGPITAATTAMSLIPGPAGLVVAGFAALAVGIGQWNDHLAKLSEETAAQTRALGTSNEALAKFAEFSKKATATEVMDKRRSQSAGQFFNIVPGKTTFGESYMKTDAGKALIKSIDKEVKDGGGLKNAEKLITNQLSDAIASGVMTPAQARSIAANLGVQMKDMNFGLNVTASLTDIMGPNGENLKNQPLEVRMKIIQSSLDQVRQNAAALNKTTGNEGASKQLAKEGDYAAKGFVAGGVAGLGVAGLASVASSAGLALAAEGTIIGGLAAAGSAVPVIGTIAGALAGMVIAGMQYQEQITKQSAALAESVGNTLEVEQQMVDSLQTSYEKRIAEAKAAGDTAEAVRLQNQYLTDQKALLESNKTTNKELLKTYEDQSAGWGFMFNSQVASSDELNKSIEEAYKGSGMENEAKLAREAVDNSAGTQGQENFIKSAMAKKQLGISQANVAMQTFGTTSEGMKQLSNLLTSSPVEANRTLGIASNITNKTLQKQFLTQQAALSPEKLLESNNALELANKTRGVFSGKASDAIVNFSVKNEGKMIQFQKNIENLKNQKTITVAIGAKMLGGKDGLEAINSKFSQFKKYNKQNKVVFLTELQQVLAMKGDKDMVQSFKVWRKEQGDETLTFADYAAYQADRTVTTQGVDNTTGDGSNTKTSQAPSPSVLDPFVQMLREGVNWQQKLTVGWKASYAALKKYGEDSLKVMAGYAVRLKQQGVSSDIIDVFMGATEEEQNKILDRRTGKLKNGALSLLKELKKIKDMKEYGLAYILMSDSQRLEKDNELYQAGLDDIATKEKAINDKYDERIKALDEIGKIQDRNNQQQQDTLDVADALSKGDIAAAARAALKAKENEQKRALEDARTSLENAKKKELSEIQVTILNQSRDRKWLEEQIAINSRKIADAKLDEMNRQAQIAKDALASATAAANALRDGKALANLPTGGGSGSGSGNGTDNGGNNPPPPPPKKQAVPLGSKASIEAGQAGRAAVTKAVADAASGLTTKNNVVKAATEYMKQLNLLKTFTTASGKPYDMSKVSNRKFATNAEDIAKLAKIDTAMNAAKAELKANNVVAETNGLFYSKFGSGVQNIMGNIDFLKGQSAEYYKWALGTGDAIKDASSKLPPEAIWLVQNAGYSNFEADFKKYTDNSSGGAQRRLKLAFEKSTDFKATDDLAAIMANPTSAAAFTKAYKDSNGNADMLQGDINQVKNINDKWVNALNYRKALIAMGYKSSDLSPILGVNWEKEPKNVTLINGGKGYSVNEIDKIGGAKRYASGGIVYARTGKLIESSKYALGTDTVPAMLTPGEIVMQKSAVDRIGAKKLLDMNDGTYRGESVYNYSITVNADSSNAQDIADAVLREVRRVDSQRIRSSRV